MNSNTTFTQQQQEQQVQAYFEEAGICLLKVMNWEQAQFSIEEDFATKGGFSFYDKYNQQWGTVTNAQEVEDTIAFYEAREKQNVADHIRMMG